MAIDPLETDGAARGGAMYTTLVDVAARAGVSRQTVSNTINTPELVRPATRERVLTAIDELGYEPNVQARRLRTRSVDTIGIRLEPVQDGITGILLDRFLHAVTNEAAGRGIHVMLFTATDERDEVRQILELRRRSLADAFVLTATHRGDPRIAELLAHGLRFAAFGQPWDEGSASHRWVDVDGAAGTRMATSRLLDEGYERIAFLGWPAGSDAGDHRRRGWSDALQNAGGPDARLEAAANDDAVEAAAAATDLIGAGADAIVCASDTLALAAIGALTAADAAMPVVGFDNTGVAAGLGFTSVDQDLDSVARTVLDLLQTTGSPDRSPLIRPRLVPRHHPRWGLHPARQPGGARRKESP